jgi:uncharacterized membrane protein YozB (DUF420 family)
MIDALAAGPVAEGAGIPGLFGTRADGIIDAVTALQFIGVFALVVSVRAVRRGRVRLHRTIQLTLAAALTGAVIALEFDVRSRGGLEAFVSGGRFEGTRLVAVVFHTHLMLASVNALLWLSVPAIAWRQFRRGRLPGSFSCIHRVLGRATAIALFATVGSATVLYVIGFAL